MVNRSSNPLPAYATPDSAGMDLRAHLPGEISLAPLERVLVATGLFIQLPGGYEAQVRPRSGIALHQGLGLLNAPGTIDPDYRGEIKVLMINLSGKTQTIAPGDRIAQLVISPFSQAVWEETPALEPSLRGEGGFGHTGKS
ncbi:MAG TPA: dUTP diphosphatase [Chitinophagaceae bacterium]|nr:dUTP diphosphatase [Chitinophagaceae bacterium]